MQVIQKVSYHIYSEYTKEVNGIAQENVFMILEIAWINLQIKSLKSHRITHRGG